MLFEDTETPLFSTDDTKLGFWETVEVEPTKEIRFISMLMDYNGYFFEGIRLLDSKKRAIVDETWDHNPNGTWSEL